MLNFILRRILYSIPVLIVASFLTFWVIRTTFDPLARFRSSRDSARLIAQQRKALHLDHSIIWQWWHWLTGFLHGDMGSSWRTHESVSSMIGRASWPTLQLLFWGTLLSLTIAIGIGVYSAVKQYSIGDYAFTGLSYLGLAMPPFWFGLLAIGLLVTYPKTHWHLDE